MPNVIRVTPTNRSGTITSGGVAQTFSSVTTGRNGFSVQNQSAGSLWISTTGTAVANHTSLEIKPGQLYESMEQGCPQGAISIIGATTGQAFFGEEW